MSSTRPYVMGSRAEAAAETHRRILHAVRDLAMETLNLDPTLDLVAKRAGVSVQTVLRRFGSREALFDAALTAATAEIVEERQAPVGDCAAAVRIIVDHYELRGDFVLRMLGREHDDERIARVVGPGRVLHRAWVEQVFAPMLPGSSATDAAEKDPTVDLLVVSTDVYTWKLLRRDRGLTRSQTESRMLQLVIAVVLGAPTDHSAPGGRP